MKFQPFVMESKFEDLGNEMGVWKITASVLTTSRTTLTKDDVAKVLRKSCQ